MSRLLDDDRKTLLRIARNAVESSLSGRQPDLPDIRDGVMTEALGAFVSIHESSQLRKLRGCVGNISPDKPLFRTVAHCAVAAATDDNRFEPITLAEIPDVDFEISVLDAPERVSNAAEIEVGTHGLIVGKGRHLGLLLPQVAAQYGWDAERFLAETCLKAGLNPEAWRRGADIYRFTAEIFGEKPDA